MRPQVMSGGASVRLLSRPQPRPCLMREVVPELRGNRNYPESTLTPPVVSVKRTATRRMQVRAWSAQSHVLPVPSTAHMSSRQDVAKTRSCPNTPPLGPRPRGQQRTKEVPMEPTHQGRGYTM